MLKRYDHRIHSVVCLPHDADLITSCTYQCPPIVVSKESIRRRRRRLRESEVVPLLSHYRGTISIPSESVFIEPPLSGLWLQSVKCSYEFRVKIKRCTVNSMESTSLYFSSKHKFKWVEVQRVSPQP